MNLVDNKTIEKLKYDLVRDNLLSFDDLERAGEIAQAQNINVGQVLINSSLISEEKLLKFLEDKLHIPYVDLEDYEIDKKCLEYISYKEASKYKVLPLFEIEGTVTVAMSDPLDLFAIDNIIESMGKSIEPVVSSEKSILNKINEYYEKKDKVQDINLKEGDKDQTHWIDMLHQNALSENHIQDLFRAILKYAIQENIHEIFFEITKDGLGVNFKYPTETILTGVIPSLLINPFMAKVKSIAGLDPLVSEIPQLGKMSFNVNEVELTAILSVFPTISGERIFLKIYHPPKSLLNLGLNPKKISVIQNSLNTAGIILICGSSLSGKTHIAYSILEELVQKNKTVMTIESVAKYKLPNIQQCELNENTGFNLDKAMRFIEFQYPEVIYFENISTKESLDYFSSLVMKDKTVVTEFLADNIDDLRRKLDYSEFSLFKSLIKCVIFIHSKESVEVFNKENLDKYLF